MCFLAEKETRDDDYLAKGSEMSSENITGTKRNDPECHMFPALGSLMCCTSLRRRQLCYVKGLMLFIPSSACYFSQYGSPECTDLCLFQAVQSDMYPLRRAPPVQSWTGIINGPSKGSHREPVANNRPVTGLGWSSQTETLHALGSSIRQFIHDDLTVNVAFWEGGGVVAVRHSFGTLSYLYKCYKHNFWRILCETWFQLRFLLMLLIWGFFRMSLSPGLSTCRTAGAVQPLIFHCPLLLSSL